MTTKTAWAENIRATWDLFKHDSGVLEVRALLKKTGENKQVWEGWGDIISGYFDDIEAFTGCVAGLDRTQQVKGIYVTMNPVLPALMGRAQNRLIAAGKRSPTTSDDDIVSRKTLLIDADPFRPAEIASTQDEMEAAIAKRDEVAAWLYSQGFPPFYNANSGNGAHLVGRIDLPNNEVAKLLVNDFLECLNWKFGAVPSDSSEAKRAFAQGLINVGIDTTVFNASRITKLYGSAARKGDNTDDRPHRRAQFTYTPEQSEVIPTELLERIAQEYRDHKAGQEREKQRGRKPLGTNVHKPAADWSATVESVEQWFRDHGVTLGSRETYTKNGYQYKWDVDCIMSSAHNDGACVMWGDAKGLGYKCHHNGCKGLGWADVRNLIAPKTYTNGHSNKTAQQPANTDSDDLAQPDLLLSVDEVLQAIGDIGAMQYTDLDTDPDKAKEKAAARRKARIVKELGFAIGELERTDHALVIDALVHANAGFAKSDARAFVGGCVADHKKRHKAAQRQRAEQARENLLAVRAKKGKASIDVGGRQLSDVVGEALQVLEQSNNASPRIFVRNGALSRIAQDERGFYGIQEFDDRAMLHELAEVADWETVVIDVNGIPKTKAVDPPINAIREIFGRPGWSEFPPLAGVVTSPVFSRDGALHDQPGYNPATRLYYTGGVTVGDTTPTTANIERAKDLILNNLLIDFPFKDDASRAHAVAYLLLPFVRDMIDGPTPVHDVDSPTAGTGKGKLLNACAYTFLGHDVPTQPAVEDDNEWRKIITTRLMSGDTHLIIDNVNHELNSGSLASAFTQPVWTDRTLGANREVKIPIRTIWGITANNIRMSQELARRSLWIRLDANVEKPWERTEFKHTNLMGWARANRNHLVTAALTFIRAWIDRGMPLYDKRTKGSYESWAGVMGGILEAVGIPGFLENENELYERVVSKNDLLIDFVKAWWEVQRNRETARRAELGQKGKSEIDPCLSSYELFKLASYADDEAQQKMGEWHNLLADMLTSQKQKGRQTQLGKILDTHHDKVVAGFKISLAKTANGSKFWMLHPASVEPRGEVLPGSTKPLPPVGPAFDKVLVEPAEHALPATHGKLNFFSHGSNGREKNNTFFIAPGAEVSTGSTNNGTNGASTGGSGLVEPQTGSTEVLPEIEVVTWEL